MGDQVCVSMGYFMCMAGWLAKECGYTYTHIIYLHTCHARVLACLYNGYQMLYGRVCLCLNAFHDIDPRHAKETIYFTRNAPASFRHGNKCLYTFDYVEL